MIHVLGAPITPTPGRPVDQRTSSVRCGQGLGKLGQRGDREIRCLKVAGVASPCPGQPCRAQTRAGGAVDVPGMDGDQHHVGGVSPAGSGGIFIGFHGAASSTESSD